MKKPDFFIVGAPKCGTTALNAYLTQHPEIFLPKKKELHYFGADLVFSRPKMTEPMYMAHFSEANGEKRVGEAAVWYLYSKQAATEIKEFNSATRIIVMLRNPVEMMYALHAQRLFNDNEDIFDFAEALAAEEERKQGWRLYKNAANIMGFFYRDAATYTPQIQRYLQVFGEDSVHVIIFDDFTNNTPQVYRDTCEFLRVDPHFLPEFSIINANKSVRSKTLRGFLRYPSPRTLAVLRTLIPTQPRHKLKDGLKRFNRKYEPRRPMDPELRRHLKAEFLPEVERLSALLRRDLTHWCR